MDQNTASTRSGDLKPPPHLKHKPDILEMFKRLNIKHFDGVIPQIQVVWNVRLTTTAGRCRSRHKEAVEIELSEKLFKLLNFDTDKIRETLIHEMVHAFLMTKYKITGHPRVFQEMMTNITGIVKNHRCHSYDTRGIEGGIPKKFRGECSRCKKVYLRVRLPRKNDTCYCKCDGAVYFSIIDVERISAPASFDR